MGRNVTIQIWNRTGRALTFGGENQVSGKYQKGYEPPPEIGDNNLGIFVVGNKTGENVGPQGSLFYSVRGEKTTAVTVDWNHPWSEAESAYHCYGDSPGLITAVLFPDHPTGEDQEICWTVFTGPAANE
jgi:hypothetical protein